LDSHLVPRTYLVSNYLTAADVALYGALHPVIVCACNKGPFDPCLRLTILQSKLQPVQYYSHPALTRYFDHIQSRPTIRNSAAALSSPFSLVSFDLDNTPALERKVEPSKKKEKSKPATTEKAEATILTAETSTTGEKKAQKKDKGEKKKDVSTSEQGGKKKASEVGGTPAGDAGEPVPSMIDLRVGYIVDGMPC
jgi:aminoacyl tRNA synthase complex-interacting multifunctional protein 1